MVKNKKTCRCFKRI
ncbi:hypothetical protein CAJAP_08545 [Camponotus japonicus]